MPVRDRFFQVPVRGRDNVDVYWLIHPATDSSNGALFQYSQQFTLQLRLHIADFIEQQSSTVSELKNAFFVAFSVCEGTFNVAEKFPLYKILRQRGTVDGYIGNALIIMSFTESPKMNVAG